MKAAIKNYFSYPTDKLFKESNELNIKNLYFEISIIYIYNKRNILFPLNYGVKNRYVIEKYSQFWPKRKSTVERFSTL